jgi:hypothetical protein
MQQARLWLVQQTPRRSDGACLGSDALASDRTALPSGWDGACLGSDVLAFDRTALASGPRPARPGCPVSLMYPVSAARPASLAQIRAVSRPETTSMAHRCRKNSIDGPSMLFESGPLDADALLLRLEGRKWRSMLTSAPTGALTGATPAPTVPARATPPRRRCPGAQRYPSAAIQARNATQAPLSRRATLPRRRRPRAHNGPRRRCSGAQHKPGAAIQARTTPPQAPNGTLASSRQAVHT